MPVHHHLITYSPPPNLMILLLYQLLVLLILIHLSVWLFYHLSTLCIDWFLYLLSFHVYVIGCLLISSLFIICCLVFITCCYCHWTCKGSEILMAAHILSWIELIGLYQYKEVLIISWHSIPLHIRYYFIWRLILPRSTAFLGESYFTVDSMRPDTSTEWKLMSKAHRFHPQKWEALTIPEDG